MDELNLIIANNISTLRTLNGMTQSELAEKLSYTDKLVSKWERGDGVPNAYTLKLLSEIFGVSVDYLFADHRNDRDDRNEQNKKENTAQDPTASAATEQITEPKSGAKVSQQIITAITICGIWLGALLLFIILWILAKPYFSVFVYTFPVSVITLLVLNSVFNKGRHNFFIIAALIASVALAVYIALLKFNCWQIFLLLIPAEFIVFLCALLKRKIKKQNLNSRPKQ